jgi:hypothetical protein
MYIGIMFLIIGLAWRRIDYSSGNQRPHLSVGNFYMISGLLFLLFFGFGGVPWVIISVTTISAGVLFVIAKEKERKGPRPATA